MPRKTDTVYQEPITAALLKSRRDSSDVGSPFPYGSNGWAPTPDNSVNATPTPPFSYTNAFSASKQTGNPNVDAIANVVRSKVGNLDVFLRSQGAKPEEYTPQQLKELNGQLDDAITECARGFAEDGWSADAVKEYADKAWRADLGATFFQKTLSNAVAYLPMSAAMLGVSFLLTPILGPLPTMVVGLGVGLYTAYKWSVHALNAAGKVDAKVNDEKEGRGRFWGVCPSKGLWQAVGKETLADLAFRTGPRGATKAVGGGVKLGLQASGAAPGFTALFGGLILPAVSAVIGPPTNGAMQVASKMLHGKDGERSAAPLFGIKLEKKKDDSGKETTRICADAGARRRNVNRLGKSSGRRFLSMAKKMALEYRRSYGDAFREEKKAGMKGKWWELIFGSNVLPGGTLGDLVSLGGEAIGATAGNVVSTFGNVATSVVTGPGNVATRGEVGRHTYNKPKPVKASPRVTKQATVATGDTPGNATAPAHAEHGLNPSPVRTLADRPMSRLDHRGVELPASLPAQRLPATAPAAISRPAPTRPNVPVRFPNVQSVPPHLVSPSTEHVVESHTVIPRSEVRSFSDPVLEIPAIPATLASPPIVGIGGGPRVDPRNPPAPNLNLGALPIEMQHEEPAQLFGRGNQTAASQPPASTVGLEHAFEAPISNQVEKPAAAAVATDSREPDQNNGRPSAASACSQESICESRDARPIPQAPKAGACAENKTDLNASVPTYGDELHAIDATASNGAGNDAPPDLGREDRTGKVTYLKPRCGFSAPDHNEAPAPMTSHTLLQSTPPNTPRGISNRIAIPPAGRPLLII